MKILFFGRYDPEYSRNRVFLKSLQVAGVTVEQCRTAPSNRLWPVRLLWKYLFLKKDFDLMFIPFPGQEVMLIARYLTRKPIIFDAFTSHFEGYVQDRGTVPAGSLRAGRLRWLDKQAYVRADLCLSDTSTHADWMAKEFGVPREKFHTVFVGTDTDVFKPAEKLSHSSAEPFLVHFHGSYIPLQGTQTIVRAAAKLKDKDVRVRMIGRGQTHEESRSLAREIRADNVDFVSPVSYEELAHLMQQADACLGTFGTTPKAQRVISNKVFEALGVAKPVITADTPAVRELLDRDSALLVPSGDPEALSEAILKLKEDQGLRERLARAGHERLESKAAGDILGERIVNIIHESGLLQT